MSHPCMALFRCCCGRCAALPRRPAAHHICQLLGGRCIHSPRPRSQQHHRAACVWRPHLAHRCQLTCPAHVTHRGLGQLEAHLCMCRNVTPVRTTSQRGQLTCRVPQRLPHLTTRPADAGQPFKTAHVASKSVKSLTCNVDGNTCCMQLGHRCCWHATRGAPPTKKSRPGTSPAGQTLPWKGRGRQGAAAQPALRWQFPNRTANATGGRPWKRRRRRCTSTRSTCMAS